MKCELCGKTIKGFGNNAEPLAHGKCCDDCNRYVIAHRWGLAWYPRYTAEYKKSVKELFDKKNPTAVVGARVIIYEMYGEPEYTGKAGIIQHIDDLGQLHGTWGGCAIIPERDTYAIIPTEVSHNG